MRRGEKEEGAGLRREDARTRSVVSSAAAAAAGVTRSMGMGRGLVKGFVLLSSQRV